jgi:mono/diheme cytochrome c family protein
MNQINRTVSGVVAVETLSIVRFMLPASLLAAAFSASLLGCATSQPVQAIEPPGGAHGEGGGGTVEPHPSGGATEKFVISREPQPEEKPPTEDSLHIGDKWWRFRGGFLKLTEGQVRERDMAVSMKQAPQNFWDPQTALETVQIWSGLCNQCHGGRRNQSDAVNMPAPPPAWGQGEGIFFGSRRQYAELFNTVTNGGPKHEGRVAMPAWKSVLAKEQIWALLYFLEYQSGGIEGRFPPSLYPRIRTDVGQQ